MRLFTLSVVVIMTSRVAAEPREVSSFKIPHDGRSLLYSVVLSPDGKTITAGGFQKVYVCDSDSGKLRATLALADEVSALAFSPDGKSLAAVDRNEVKLWDTATNKETALLATKRHGGHVLSLAFSPDGKNLAVGSVGGEVRVWDVSIAKLREQVEHDRVLFGAVAFSPDGKTLALSGSNSFGDAPTYCRDTATGKKLFDLRGHAQGAMCLQFAPDGKTLAGAGNNSKVILWDASTGKELRVLKGHDDWVTAIGFSPDGKSLAAGDKKGKVFVWDAATGAERAKLSCGGWTRLLVFPKPDELMTATSDGAVKRWDLSTGGGK